MPTDPYTGGFLASILTEEEVVCRGCGHKWTVEFREEFAPTHWAGRWVVNDEDLLCPTCGAEGD